MLEEQKSEVEKVLGELEITGKPVIEVMNKADLVAAGEAEVRPQKGRVWVSALTGQGLDVLLKAIDDNLVVDPVIEASFCLPQSEGAVLAALEGGSVLSQKQFEGNSVLVTAKGPASLLNRFRRFRLERGAKRNPPEELLEKGGLN